MAWVTNGFMPLAMACGHHARNHTWEAGSAPQPTYQRGSWNRMGAPNRAIEAAAYSSRAVPDSTLLRFPTGPSCHPWRPPDGCGARSFVRGTVHWAEAAPSDTARFSVPIPRMDAPIRDYREAPSWPMELVCLSR